MEYSVESWDGGDTKYVNPHTLEMSIQLPSKFTQTFCEDMLWHF
jgi:hypothetical protein